MHAIGTTTTSRHLHYAGAIETPLVKLHQASQMCLNMFIIPLSPAIITPRFAGFADESKSAVRGATPLRSVRTLQMPVVEKATADGTGTQRKSAYVYMSILLQNGTIVVRSSKSKNHRRSCRKRQEKDQKACFFNGGIILVAVFAAMLLQRGIR